ncbi:unnamed protein product [Mucor circinelloides]|uniref:Uncharacterized protein n=1 Tax=Mucor circinelloides f. circinelloides (strain 1006PhL) TaxID=1220926 RepID=S2K273_MUCC1|nr:hypothetical protein HMPREF1544_06927 [Mucor circinelloides 1006PhL]
MGAQYSTEVKYVYTTINGNRVAIPYMRLSNGQWVPLQQQSQQQWYIPQYSHQHYLNQHVASPLVTSRNLYPMISHDYFLPSNQTYYGNFFR